MTEFNGHKNWNHWNVSLWINNDVGLYRMAKYMINELGSKDDAAIAFKDYLGNDRITHTPDGAPYSVSSIRAAMVGM